MASDQSLASWQKGVLALAGTAALILWLGQCTDIDLALADTVYDWRRGSFPMQHAWFAEQFNHVILKALLSCLAGGVVVLALRDAWRPNRKWDPVRRLGMRVVAMSAVAVPTVISVLKRFSSSHCPWDLERYGGTAPYIRLLELMPDGIGAGHCLPGGHASSALWLISLAAFWWPRNPRCAAICASSMMLFGLSVGWVQQLRGAHFLTHTLWSAWIACAVVMVIYILNVRSLAKSNVFGYSSLPRNAAQSMTTQ